MYLEAAGGSNPHFGGLFSCATGAFRVQYPVMTDSRFRLLLASAATLLVAAGTFVLLELLVPRSGNPPGEAERDSPVADVARTLSRPAPAREDREPEEENELEALILSVKQPTVTRPPGDIRRYRDAVREAEKEGPDRLLQSLDGAGLWDLADAARFTGLWDLARKALLSIRTRFKDSPRARIAAFLLGRMAVEVQADPGEAARWFLIYLREDPGGPLAEQALGRRIYACREAGLKAESCRVAAKYLELYPQGPHSEYARSVLRYKAR